MKKLFVLFVMSLLVVAASAQKFSWPPKSFPMKVPFAVSEEVKYYWDVQGVLCTGRGNGGYKFCWEQPITTLRQVEALIFIT